MMWEALSVVGTVLGWIGWLGIGIVPVAIAALVVWFNPALLRPAIAVAGVWVAVFLSYTIGDGNGAARVRAEWDEAKIEYAESMEGLRKSAQASAALQSAQAAEAERIRADTAEQRIADYERTLAAAPAGACSFDDADLNAAGMHAPQSGGRGNGRPLRRNPQ